MLRGNNASNGGLLDKPIFRENVIFMKTETTPTPSLLATQLNGQHLATAFDVRRAFRQNALVGGPTCFLEHTVPADVQIDHHWILDKEHLVRMIEGVKDDLAELVTAEHGETLSSIAVIELLGFLREPTFNGLLGETRFMARFFFACTRLSFMSSAHLLRTRMQRRHPNRPSLTTRNFS